MLTASLNVFAASIKKAENYHFLVITDTHVGVKHQMDIAPSGYDHENDLDDATYFKLLNKIKNLLQQKSIKPQSILILGDLVNHPDGSVLTGSYACRKEQLHKNFSLLQKTFPDIPLIYIFGNNDSLSGDYLSFYSDANDMHSPWEVAEEAGWKSGVLSTGRQCTTGTVQSYPCYMLDSLRLKDGFAVLQLAPKLRLIILNTVMYNRAAFTWHGDQYNGEPAWFEEQLKKAEADGASVLIAMHIPPGTNMLNGKLFWEDAAKTHFMDSINKYGETVAGILAAHTHMDELRLLLNQRHIAVPMFISPGLSTSHGNAPAFRHYSVRRSVANQPWKFSDYTTYYYAGIAFKKLYDFQSYYCTGIKNTSAGDCLVWYPAHNELKKLLTLVNKHYTAGNPNDTRVLTVNPEQLLIQ